MTTLTDWAKNGWLIPHRPSAREMEGLIAIVERGRRDSAVAELSRDSRLVLLFSAGLKLADAALRLAGYRAVREGHHYRVIAALPLSLGIEFAEDAEVLERVRVLRNKADYEAAGFATDADIDELREVVERLLPAVRRKQQT